MCLTAEESLAMGGASTGRGEVVETRAELDELEIGET